MSALLPLNKTTRLARRSSAAPRKCQILIPYLVKIQRKWTPTTIEPARRPVLHTASQCTLHQHLQKPVPRVARPLRIYQELALFMSEPRPDVARPTRNFVI